MGRLAYGAALIVLTAATACGSGGGSRADSTAPAPAGTAPAPVRPAISWPTYHGANDRAGFAAVFPAPRTLGDVWTAGLDGAVYGQPIVVGGTAYVGTENDTVYALDLATGRQVWRRHIGTPVPRSALPCGNIDPLGITGTSAYDPGTRTVFVAAETTGGRHTLVGLNAADGRVRLRRDLDVVPGRDRTSEQQRGALAVAGGRVYVPFGGLDGDCGNYVGYVAAARADGGGRVASYAVPTRRMGGMWAPSGPAVGASGDVYVAVGNGASLGGAYDGSDSVLRLSADLSRRLSYFAPKNWGSENSADQDLGSTGPLLLPGDRVMIAGKTGDIYLLDGHDLGGVGGGRASLHGCVSFGGMARDGSSVFLPCEQGLQRVDVTGGDALRRVWRAPGNVKGSPVVGGGAVWTLDTDAGVLHALAESDGHSLASRRIGEVSRFASPTLAGSLVLVPTMRGVTAVSVR
ncbi:outer membrane protein assembly factor BamB family protein [Actinoallomurus rhizosphaericola]|uniref:outer membrane protein assembly factor BamB family protein n=1 Tax=Actinoallomurus rhizosphaericola TaxID=2952536 RepID=UPI0020931051|nr:PQQ-binding-like beta-propeller repeat protein [Actinoallomurus rhizosphaericola]MCO5997838.1 PQQ-binding-like beta-propeller repeat protein [Actinoallomurus rhizosphaericola]